MVNTFRVGQGCALASPAFERVARPTVEDDRRAPTLRFGDPRIMALAGALRAPAASNEWVSDRDTRGKSWKEFRRIVELGLSYRAATSPVPPATTISVMFESEGAMMAARTACAIDAGAM
jgi:hypothetical protein